MMKNETRVHVSCERDEVEERKRERKATREDARRVERFRANGRNLEFSPFAISFFATTIVNVVLHTTKTKG